MINKYPYSDMHELNADWLLSKTAELEGRVKTLEESGVTDFMPTYYDGLEIADYQIYGGATGKLYVPTDVLPKFDNAGYHNSIYRGAFLGSSISDEQYEQIVAGTFDDMFVGDYWTISTTFGGTTKNVKYVIAAFDYWWNVGDTFPQGSNKHHIVLIPSEILYSAKMNTTNITTGGYVGSEMYTTNLVDARTGISNAFSGHLYQVRRLFTNAVGGDGFASGWETVTSTVDLLSETMVYGSKVWGNSVREVGSDRNILPLFVHDPASTSIRSNWWLRSVASATAFTCVRNSGDASTYNPSVAIGVRPCFAIY